MASIDELRKQQMMEKAGVKPPVPGLVQQAQTIDRFGTPQKMSVDDTLKLRNQSAAYVAGAQARAAQNPIQAVTQQTPPAAKPLSSFVSGMDANQRQLDASTASGPAVNTPAAKQVMPTEVAGWRTKAVMDGAAEDAQRAWNQGNVGGAAGSLVRGAITAVPTAVGEFAYNTVAPVAGFVKDAYAGLTGSMDSPAQAKMAAPVQAPAKPASPQPVETSSNEGRNFTNPIVAAATTQAKPQAMPQPEAPAAETPQARQIAPGIYRSGNSYGDSAEAAISGPRGSGQPSARNMAAADALASRYAGPGMTAQAQPAQGPSAYIPKDTGGYGLLDKGYRDRRAAMMDAQQMKPGARTALAALLKEQSAQGDREAQAEQNAADRGFRQGENALDRGLKSQELMARMDDSAATRQLRAQELQDNMLTNAARREASGVETASAKQMAELRNQYLNAKTDAERNDAARKLQALSGKADTSLKDNFLVVGGGQEWDANAMAMRNVPQQLIDLRTGRPVTGGQQAPAQGQFEVGKVYTDAQGRKAKYTENGWQPI